MSEEISEDEMNEYTRESWEHIKEVVLLVMKNCPDKKCDNCKCLKEDIEMIGELIDICTEKREPEKGTTM